MKPFFNDNACCFQQQLSYARGNPVTPPRTGHNDKCSSICKVLKESFTRKEFKSRANLDVRQNCCWMISNISDDRILFIDETGISLHVNPHYGYSPAGLTANNSEPANKGVNISV
ncbi:hypothetical protein RF11_07900 [Thelohanellus kitauei]|uniref:Tc1-like transposase DDE domain-containing protein n=1 Tax=Thelohanellus kitauei TaxID=669202 RepID=A0A0C2MFS8_THEKT|nr:hypothetical protein RF11_07900 [Thelohanellus kitauei]